MHKYMSDVVTTVIVTLLYVANVSCCSSLSLGAILKTRLGLHPMAASKLLPSFVGETQNKADSPSGDSSAPWILCNAMTKIRMACSAALGPVQGVSLSSDLHGTEHRDTSRVKRNPVEPSWQ